MFNIYKLKKAFSSNATNKYVSWVNIGKIRTSNEYLVDKNEMNDSLNSMDLDFGDEDYSGENSKPVVEDQSDIEDRSEEHTSELQSRQYLVCRLLLEKKKKIYA